MTAAGNRLDSFAILIWPSRNATFKPLLAVSGPGTPSFRGYCGHRRFGSRQLGFGWYLRQPTGYNVIYGV
jgi:hypothetical protein